MLAQVCILRIFESHFTFPYILSALQQKELSTFQLFGWYPSDQRISNPASLTTSCQGFGYQPPCSAICHFVPFHFYAIQHCHVSLLYSENPLFHRPAHAYMMRFVILHGKQILPQKVLLTLPLPNSKDQSRELISQENRELIS